ncbi:MAG: hypothetical protein HQL72_09460 [Magnetococcales bacterium]|nr:hypothetical protein [Magnetococcales bacterium]
MIRAKVSAKPEQLSVVQAKWMSLDAAILLKNNNRSIGYSALSQVEQKNKGSCFLLY